METKEREISLTDLFWKIIFAWRAWLLCGVIFAVLVAAACYVKDERTYKTAVTEQKTKNTEEDISLTEDEYQQVQYASSIQVLLDNEKEYAENSILMNLDAYQENVLVLQYYVKSDYTWNMNEDIAEDYTPAVLAAYADYVKSGDVAKAIRKQLKLDVDENYIEELIAADADNILTVRIIYKNEKDLKQIAGVVEGCLAEQTPAISGKIGSHSLELISENITVQADRSLASEQVSLQAKIADYKSQLDTLMENMTDDQKTELNMIDGGEETNGDMADTALPEKPSVRLKYVALGFVIGVFLAAAWVFCVSIFTSRLQNCRELEQVYGLRLFGTLEKKKKVTGVDKALLNMKNRKQKQFSEEAAFLFLASNLELTCEAEHVQKLFLTGTEIEHMEEQWVSRFIEKMGQAGISVIYGENVCYDATTLKNASEAGYAILLEESGRSIYGEIEKEIKTLEAQNVKVLGCIGVEGL